MINYNNYLKPQASKLPNPKFYFRFGISVLKSIWNCQGPVLELSKYISPTAEYRVQQGKKEMV